MDIDLATLPVQQLLTLDRQILNELRQRQIVRTANSPVGDWDELLVATAFGGELAPNSEKSYDVLTPDNQRLERSGNLASSQSTAIGRTPTPPHTS